MIGDEVHIILPAVAPQVRDGHGAGVLPLQRSESWIHRRTETRRMKRIMIGDEVRIIPTAAARVGGVVGLDDEVGDLMHELDQVIDMICVWGDVGDGLGALGDLFDFFGTLSEI